LKRMFHILKQFCCQAGRNFSWLTPAAQG